MKAIDNFLNSITMYRLVLYSLTILALIAIIFGFAGVFAFSGFSLLASLVVIVAASFFSNQLLAKSFSAITNIESAYITAFILFFLLEPQTSLSGFLLLAGASVIAMASKYVLAVGKKHIFNPAAIALVILGFIGSSIGIWWVATPLLFPFVFIAGLLIARKTRRLAMVGVFTLCAVLVALIVSRESITITLVQLLISWPLVFFGTVMLTEPLTSPTTKRAQLIYAAVIGILFTSQLHFGKFFTTPEMVLIIGNVLTFFISSQQKRILSLIEQRQLTPGIFEFIFKSNKKLVHTAGQYLEWTLPHDNPDTRGNRRYFTIASSPSDNFVRLGVRIDKDKSSSFKKKLLTLKPNETIAVSQLSGDFVLPTNENQKLVFIAGGIGVTPFRSMITHLVDTKQKRDIVLLYAANNESDFAYKELFDTATDIGLQTIYVVKDAPVNWQGKVGFVTPEIVKEIPGYQSRLFYLSGPQIMVKNYKNMLLKMGIPRKQIKTDYFPGF